MHLGAVLCLGLDSGQHREFSDGAFGKGLPAMKPSEDRVMRQHNRDAEFYMCRSRFWLKVSVIGYAVAAVCELICLVGNLAVGDGFRIPAFLSLVVFSSAFTVELALLLSWGD
ncbi:hypothetical protein [Bifidobacterium longum]|uniref:hypothetical protein n=1 Tax=Bifidobacterium longum TaxID=216816 RepID=UPI00103CC5E5|nr:hypothetical protein [Bifidobacterium longum]